MKKVEKREDNLDAQLIAALTVLSVSQYDLVVSSLVLVHIIFNAVRSS